MSAAWCSVARYRCASGEEARTLVVEGSLDEGGRIMSLRSMAGLRIQANGKQFVEQRNPRSEARWEAALKQLDELELVQDS